MEKKLFIYTFINAAYINTLLVLCILIFHFFTCVYKWIILVVFSTQFLSLFINKYIFIWIIINTYIFYICRKYPKHILFYSIKLYFYNRILHICRFLWIDLKLHFFYVVVGKYILCLCLCVCMHEYLCVLRYSSLHNHHDWL